MNAPNQLSFLPDDYLQRKSRRRTGVICAGLFLIVAGAIASAWFLMNRSMKGLEARHDEIQQQYNQAGQRIVRAMQMNDQQRTLARQAELAESLIEKVPRSNLLAQLIHCKPAGVSWLDFSLESKKRQPPPPSKKPKTMYEEKKMEIAAQKRAEAEAGHPVVYDVYLRLTGVAYNDVQVSHFLSNLQGCALLTDVNLLVSEQYKLDDQPMRKFQIEMKVRPGAEIEAPAPEDPAAAPLPAS